MDVTRPGRLRRVGCELRARRHSLTARRTATSRTPTRRSCTTRDESRRVCAATCRTTSRRSGALRAVGRLRPQPVRQRRRPVRAQRAERGDDHAGAVRRAQRRASAAPTSTSTSPRRGRRRTSSRRRSRYRTGQVTHGTQLANVPIIDLRGSEHLFNDIHTDYHSYVMRARLDAANGGARQPADLDVGQRDPRTSCRRRRWR